MTGLRSTKNMLYDNWQNVWLLRQCSVFRRSTYASCYPYHIKSPVHKLTIRSRIAKYLFLHCVYANLSIGPQSCLLSRGGNDVVKHVVQQWPICVMHVFAFSFAAKEMFMFLSHLCFHATVFFFKMYTLLLLNSIPKTKPNIGKRAFSAAASTIWN